MSANPTFLSGNITDIPFDKGFFILGDANNIGVNYYGEKLYNAYKNTAPTLIASTSLSLQGVTFKVSNTSKFYYGCYKSQMSRWPSITKYFAIFYKYEGETSFPTIEITFPNTFQDSTTVARDLKITLQLSGIKQFSQTLNGKLIPIFAYENKDQPNGTYPNPSSLGDDAMGWVYPYTYQYVQNSSSAYYPDVTGDNYNIPTSWYGFRIKATYTAINASSDTKLPLFVLDMNNPQADKAITDEFSDDYSESCIIPDSVTTQFYRGNENNLVLLKNTNVSSPVVGTRFYGDKAIRNGSYDNLSDADYGMACGIGFIADNGSSIYIAGSRGLAQLFPNLGSTSKTISFNSGSSGGTISGATSTTVFLNSSYGSGSGGWPTATKTRTGYTCTFKGWYTAQTGGTKINSTTKVTANSATTLYAQFTETPIVYNIIYVLNNDNVENNNPSSYTIESNTIYLNEPYCPNYIFLGWHPNAVIPAGSTGDKVFRAEWKYAYKYIWVYTGSQWERGIPWVFDGQEWKKAQSVHLFDGEWKEASY